MILFGWALLLVYLASTVLADDPIVTIIETNPLIDPLEKKIISEKDKDVQLTCVVENKPRDKEVQWVSIVTRNNSKFTIPVSTGTRSYDPFKYSIDLPSPTSWRMRIQNAQLTDEGLYSCQVQISNQNYAKAEEELVIVEKPQISDLQTSSDMYKSEGESVTMKCSATGRPSPMIKWTRMAGELLPLGGREHLKSDLVIPIVNEEHAGVYKCSASNSAGTDYRNIRLTVTFAPKVTSPNPVVQQAVGYVKELVCEVRGYPTPVTGDITWSKLGSPLHLDSRVFVRHIPGASSRITSILVFWGVRDEDFGEYVCAAKNEKGGSGMNLILQRSVTPTEDRSNEVRARASTLTTYHLYVVLLSICLHRMFFH